NLPFHDDKMLVGPETLLLIDDDPHILMALQRLFRQDGYRILTAQSAAAGFELLALNEVQVVMCDQRMPVMSGAVFFDKIKELYPHIIRIILSGYTDLDSVIDSINHGDIYRFYTKPWDNVVLRDNLRQAFHHYWQLHESAR
uniref:response regulator n=1 Tax=Janthinobacterium sp. Ant5-2-1 TaxID=1755239 RepID=UPI00128F0505